MSNNTLQVGGLGGLQLAMVEGLTMKQRLLEQLSLPSRRPNDKSDEVAGENRRGDLLESI